MTGPVSGPTTGQVDFALLEKVLGGLTAIQDPSLPPVSGDSASIMQKILEMPELAAPLMSCGLALEVLGEAMGGEERKTAVKTSKEALGAKAEERKAANDKQLAEIADRLEKMAKEKTLSIFQKIFKVIGMIVGAIASAATIALGAITGNPLLVAAGVIMAVMVVDSIVSEASDGKYSIAAGVAAIAKECGASEETAKWIGFGVSMTIMLVGVILSFGAAGAGSAAQASTTAMNVIAKVTSASNIVSGITAMGNGACTIAGAVFDYQIAQSQARTKDLEAILERLRLATETEESFLKFILEKFQNLQSAVNELVEKSNEALGAITGGAEAATAMA